MMRAVEGLQMNQEARCEQTEQLRSVQQHATFLQTPELTCL